MKALLTLSEMPENCRECPCKQDDFFIDANHDMHSVIICGVRGYNSTEPDKRPEWCPLEKVPKKLCKHDGGVNYPKEIEDAVANYQNGWNDCLNQILGTGD